jgi:hypothetical protein
MSPAQKYAASGGALVAIGVLGLWPFLSPAGRVGVLLAAGISLPVQVVAFTLLLRRRGETTGFLAAWVGGMVARMLVVALAAVYVIRSRMEGAVPMLLALAGFFFGLLLLESFHFRQEPGETA